MHPPVHALVDVPRDLPVDDRATFIGRILAVYHGQFEPLYHEVGIDCYKICTLGQAESQIEHHLLEGLKFDKKLTIRFMEDEEFYTQHPRPKVKS